MNGLNGNGANGNGVNNFVTAADVLSDSDRSSSDIDANQFDAAPINGAQVNGANGGPVQPPVVYPYGRPEVLLHRILDRHGIPGEPHTTAERLFLVVHPQVPALVNPGTTPAEGPFPPEVVQLPGGDADLEAEYDEELSDQYALEFLQAWRHHPAIQEAKELLGLRQTLVFLSLGMYAYEHLNGLTPVANFQARDWFRRTLQQINAAWEGANV